jgi:hypothetical protein
MDTKPLPVVTKRNLKPQNMLCWSTHAFFMIRDRFRLSSANVDGEMPAELWVTDSRQQTVPDSWPANGFDVHALFSQIHVNRKSILHCIF